MRFVPCYLLVLLLFSPFLLSPASCQCPHGTIAIPQSEFNIESAGSGSFHLLGWGGGGSQLRAPNAPPPPPPPPRCVPNVQKGDLPPSEIKRHNSERDCYMIIGGQIYDFTSYIARNSHPGKNEVLVPFCGQDATESYNSKHGDRNFLAAFDELLVGRVTGQNEQTAREVIIQQLKRLAGGAEVQRITQKFQPRPQPQPQPQQPARRSLWSKFTQKPSSVISKWTKISQRKAPAPAPQPTPQPAPAPVKEEEPTPAPVPVPVPSPSSSRSSSGGSKSRSENVDRQTKIIKVVGPKDNRPVENNDESLLTVNDMQNAPVEPIVQQQQQDGHASDSRGSAEESDTKISRSTKTTTFIVPSSEAELDEAEPGQENENAAELDEAEQPDQPQHIEHDQVQPQPQPQPQPIQTSPPIFSSDRRSRASRSSSDRRPIHVLVDVDI